MRGVVRMTAPEIFLAVISIIIIDIVLGGDNAIIIALASRSLPPGSGKRLSYTAP